MTDSNQTLIYEHLHMMQKHLIVPKERKNSFGNYLYRNAEDITVAVKKLLPDGCFLIMSDSICQVGDRLFVKAEVSFCFNEKSIKSEAYAELPKEKKGFDVSQLTGSCSSYARKFALNGLFSLDDSKELDAEDNRQQPQCIQKNVGLTPGELKLLSALIAGAEADVEKLMEFFKVKSLLDLSNAQYHQACDMLKVKAKTKQEYKP